MIRNPSELARLEEERKELYNVLRTGKIPDWVYRDVPNTVDKGFKKVKQHILKQIWKIEEQLGIEPREYNSSDFGRNV